jgi:hypothetical protein
MQTPVRLIGQVAAESGVTPTTVKLALYLRGLAANGASLGRAAEVTRRQPETIRRVARKFIIDFSDYRPFASVEKKGGPRPDPAADLGAL